MKQKVRRSINDERNTQVNVTGTNGLRFLHAYALLRCFELTLRRHDESTHTERLVKLKNPWGHGEWKGDWSDQWLDSDAPAALFVHSQDELKALLMNNEMVPLCQAILAGRL
jgi:hypothetical protein